MGDLFTVHWGNVKEKTWIHFTLCHCKYLHLLVLSMVPLSTNMRSNPHNALVASLCITSALTPAERHRFWRRFTVLINIIEVGWRFLSACSPSESNKKNTNHLHWDQANKSHANEHKANLNHLQYQNHQPWAD